MTTKKTQGGAALVEFALILPFLILLTFITTEFGRAMYQYNTIAKSVRDAARYLSIQLPNSHITEARNLVVYGKLTASDGDRPLALGLSTSHVPTPTWQNAGAAPIITTVTVEVSGYQFNPMVASVFGLGFGSYTFSPIRATMRSHL